jgi:DNA-binding NarL/FixJ family response regulator
MDEIIERKLKILLVEDDPVECMAFSSYVDLKDDVCLVAVTNNAAKALEYVQDYLPDAIILDLELHKGGGDGLTFLRTLRKLALNVFPYVVITTNNSSTVTYDMARDLGADFIISKHQEGYDAAYVTEFIRSLKSELHGRLHQAGIPNELLTTESVEELSRRIRIRINTELDLLGVSPKLTGRTYLVDAIQMIMNNPEHRIYDSIAQKYKKSNSSVEHAIQNAINVTWRRADIDDLKEYYTAPIDKEKGVPTTTEFIYYYARKIKDGY